MYKLQHYLANKAFLGSLSEDKILLCDCFVDHVDLKFFDIKKNGPITSFNLQNRDEQFVSDFDPAVQLTRSHNNALSLLDLSDNTIRLLGKGQQEDYTTPFLGSGTKHILGSYVVYSFDKNEGYWRFYNFLTDKQFDVEISDTYYKVVRSDITDYVFFVSQDKSILSCFDTDSQSLKWQLTLPIGHSIDNRLEPERVSSLMIFHGKALLKEKVKLGEFEYDPRNGCEDVNAVYAVDENTGQLRWVQAPTIGSISKLEDSRYLLSETRNSLVNFTLGAHHEIDLESGQTLSFTPLGRDFRKYEFTSFVQTDEHFITVNNKFGLCIFDRRDFSLVHNVKDNMNIAYGIPLISIGGHLLVSGSTMIDRYHGIPSVYIYSKT
ncbi:hypothetical protein J8L84_01695 [Alteromonas sp. MMG017]|uniref:hypothetical protein n=1 Tax=Alteromonas sp. MMG017 TaxID=2822692 RepID=UPI001B3A54CF|nr:hypothetical protein [Alteromonas sp. MMG017]MBQ4827988.1 hypothetical protein [Alteromonas sp. MMG017]